MVFIPDFTACENALTDERVRRARGRSRAGRPECESRATIGKGGLSVRTGPRWILLWTLAVGLLGVSAARGQVFGDSASNPSALRNKENQIWHVFGSVTTLDGQPAGNCAVRVQVASQSGELQALKVEGGDDPDARDKSLETNLQGEFRTDFTLDSTKTIRPGPCRALPRRSSASPNAWLAICCTACRCSTTEAGRAEKGNSLPPRI